MKILKKAALAAAVGSMIVSVSPALASEGAQVEKLDGCFIIEPDGTTTADPDARLMLLITPSGNSKSQCHGDVPAGVAPNRAVNLRDYPCFILDPETGLGTFTTDSHATVTPSGNVQSTCFIKHNK